jgi:hypothetical protein
MIEEAINRILELAKPNQVELGGLQFYDKPLTLLRPPEAPPIAVTTLAGFMDLYHERLEEIAGANQASDLFIHILSPNVVELVSAAETQYGCRRVWMRASPPSELAKFPFGQFMEPEKFLIGLQSMFQRVKIESPDGAVLGDLDYVLQIASNISAEEAVTLADDGISQKVGATQGIVLKGHTTLKPRVSLAPYRTFSEIDQPVSDFLFRVRKDDRSTVALALFEADGGRWRLGAFNAIHDWFFAALDEDEVIAIVR